MITITVVIVVSFIEGPGQGLLNIRVFSIGTGDKRAILSLLNEFSIAYSLSSFQSPNGKMWSPESVRKLFLCSETQAKIIGRHGLAGKIFAIDVIRNETSAEIIF